ncbi:MAG: hypothetical protein VKM34_10340 [Cyanobacteriota bacterium]|nr:hypothetical protein [Cyanobacteriota bacterium]
MRITNLRLEDLPGGRRAAAQVIWEQAKRPAETLSFDVGGPWADRLQLRPEAFVLACLPSAFWCGERRLRIDAALCPRLGQGLRQLTQLWAAQYSRSADLLIEPQDGWQVPDRAAREFTAAFFSGGVDALSTLLSNRLDYPLTHAGAIGVCLFLYGTNAMQMGPDGPDPERFNFYRFHQKRLQVLAESENFDLLPIITNVRRFSPSYASWAGAGYVPATLAAAHLFTGSITRVLFAANGIKINEDSEVVAVHLCSSAGLDAWIDQPGVSRMQKLELLGRWPAWLDLIQPCHLVTIPGGGSLNCGHCEKCVRTKLALLSLGLAIRPCMFDDPQLQPLRLLRCPMVSHAKISLFQGLVRPLWRADLRGIALLLWLRILVARLRLLVSPARWWG